MHVDQVDAATLHDALKAHNMGKFCHLKGLPGPERLARQAAIVAREAQAGEHFKARERRARERFKARVQAIRCRHQVDGLLRRRCRLKAAILYEAVYWQ